MIETAGHTKISVTTFILPEVAQVYIAHTAISSEEDEMP